ncbi:hypothetical protein Clacol_000588 [Clathrus columnatus]|uniref:Uncharacterized protein n=1 Tax=Clathrus columnatus TaxID=1419009 RepID=A0AAV4ZYS5_9AGAM|nr:hypothetical protein Clacol_000588 [Clathrus columnatus]
MSVPPRLVEDNSSRPVGLLRTLRRTTQRALKQCMKSHRLRVPKYDFPIRIRPNQEEFGYGEIRELYLHSSRISSVHRLACGISRLYQPVSAEEDVLLSDSDSETGIMLGGNARGLPILPTYMPKAPRKPQSQVRLGNVWDESEELFGIGDDEDVMNETPRPFTVHDTRLSQANGEIKVVVTPPSS